MGIEGPFWRAIAVFRIASVVYAAVLLLRAGGYTHPVTGWVVIGVMALWTAVTIYAYSALRGRPLLVTDLAVTLGCLMATPLVQGRHDTLIGAMPITATWMAGPVLAWGVYGGRRAGAVAAAVMSVADLWLRGRVRGFDLTSIPINGVVLLFMAGVVVAHVASLAKRSEERMQRAIELEAIGRERERLARGIHDSVLQVLALVQRKGMEIGGEAAELGRLAGEQEAVLRELVRSGPRPEHARPVVRRRRISLRLTAPGRGGRGAGPVASAGTRARRGRWPGLGRSAGRRDTAVDPVDPWAPGQEEPTVVDLCARLRRYGAALVTVSTPATPIPLGLSVAGEIAAAVGAALDNVRSHCGDEARAWILAENEDDRVIVTVRDDGPGIPEGRLEEAVAAGRMGVARSIRGRIADLGGSVTITSSGTGTEIELMVPTSASAVRRARP